MNRIYNFMSVTIPTCCHRNNGIEVENMVVRHHGTLKCKYIDMHCQLDASPIFILFIEKMWVVEYKTLKVYTINDMLEKSALRPL